MLSDEVVWTLSFSNKLCIQTWSKYCIYSSHDNDERNMLALNSILAKYENQLIYFSLLYEIPKIYNWLKQFHNGVQTIPSTLTPWHLNNIRLVIFFCSIVLKCFIIEDKHFIDESYIKMSWLFVETQSWSLGGLGGDPVMECWRTWWRPSHGVLAALVETQSWSVGGLGPI